ncbi:unnamed protein product [Cuscuta epithymum]|uniref:non-specific serine/threonine protein kinase n=1 Tax=Cuscuta epithymum TaxID=186058 RepID=A0AAV0G6U8_9ASTE|nr:unnamed protein product [Cuscuta epithymum]
MSIPQIFFSVLLLLSVTGSYQSARHNQSEFFDLMKKSLKGDFMANWDGKPLCNYSGIRCDDHGDVFQIDIFGRSLFGRFPEDVCTYLPKLRFLRLGRNHFHGSHFPASITNCSVLEELNMTRTYVTGTLPDLTPMQALRSLDLSYNLFTGAFPMSAITNLSNIQALNFNENGGFDPWQLPANLSGLRKLKYMVLTTCNLHGKIPASIGEITHLVDLELSDNAMVGKIPVELGMLRNLEMLELYYNQFEGEIPEELGNLTNLVDLDLSGNRLTGIIPDSISKLPHLQVLQVYNNTLSGKFPSHLANSTTLRILSLYTNYLSGEIPENFGTSSALVVLDLSENQFSGKLPPHLCSRGQLKYMLLLQNFFSGELPATYGKCQVLVRFRVNNNLLDGQIPEIIFGLPRASIIDLSYNRLNGSIPTTIKNAKNLSELFIQGNRISGLLPREISRAINLVKIDVSKNLLSGPIPNEIAYLKRLNELNLHGNRFNSSIPETLSSLKSLIYLDLSNNLLSGGIPQSLAELLPNPMNFSNNMLSGSIPLSFIKGGVLDYFTGNPGLCLQHDYPYPSTSLIAKFRPCSQSHNLKITKIISEVVGGTAVCFVIFGIISFLKQWFCKRRDIACQEDQKLSSSFFSYDVKSFHTLNFEEREVFQGVIERNKVGEGGSGTVYKVRLSNGETIAVKKLRSQNGVILDRELKTEVETLGSIRHKNIVKLYCYFSGLACSLLVYEYMPNGDLGEALHGGSVTLDWPIRHQIALGIAHGLAYLHHDLQPPIVHRDIKPTNILLDVDYQPKVADFGIAKVLQARGGKDSISTVIAGTYGYLAPEYAYSAKATTKYDVYSFGVVLMELITGKKPLEAEFGENKNIVYWVSRKVETREGAYDLLDKRVSNSFKECMIKALRIAVHCTYRTPALRPTMNEVVQHLMEISNVQPKQTTTVKNFKCSETEYAISVVGDEEKKIIRNKDANSTPRQDKEGTELVKL